MTPLGVHHAGIAVRSIPEALSLMASAYGLRPADATIDVPGQRARVQFLPCEHGFSLELVEPAGADSPVQSVLDRGGGLYHLCFEVDDLDTHIRRLRKLGFKAISKFSAPSGSPGRFAFLLDPQRQLVELYEPRVPLETKALETRAAGS